MLLHNATKLGGMLNGLTYTNCHKECMTPKDGSRPFFYNKNFNSLAIVVRNAKDKNYAEYIKYHIFL